MRHDGDKYTNGPEIRAAPEGIFFWLHTFKLGVYPGAILPFCIGYLADAATAIGDLTATEEASFLETHGKPHDERVQGCLLADCKPPSPPLHTESLLMGMHGILPGFRTVHAGSTVVLQIVAHVASLSVAALCTGPVLIVIGLVTHRNGLHWLFDL